MEGRQSGQVLEEMANIVFPFVSHSGSESWYSGYVSEKRRSHPVAPLFLWGHGEREIDGRAVFREGEGDRGEVIAEDRAGDRTEGDGRKLPARKVPDGDREAG